MYIINWLINKINYKSFLKSIPDDYNDDGKIGPLYMDGNEYTIHIYGREGRVPQFHILDMNNNEICSIRLDKPKYVNIPTRYLNNKELEDLERYLGSIDSNFFKGESYWEVLALCWEGFDFNKSFKIKSQPNYTLLKENK